MATKDAGEVERIRQMGAVTTTVVARTADFLSEQHAHGDILVNNEGNPLTIGAVKQRINQWLAEAGVENPHGVIFASGAEAAVPHNSGSASQAVRLGETLIFDIFPCEAGGGYYYDFTRTWCLGYAPDEVLALYEDVLHVFRTLQAELQPGVLTRSVMERACDLFEQRGHPTQRSHPQTQHGFVHGLGHSLGLSVHERPQFSLFASAEERLLPGMVMTVEPGLYYPDKSMGVRLEDTIWMRPDGTHAALAEYPLDLLLPVKRI
jgi:Xaa-Pro aminopeptidase